MFTVETSVRTAMEAVYKLTKLDKDFLEIFPTRYDIRSLVQLMKDNAGVKGAFTASDLPPLNPLKLKKAKGQILDFLNSVPPNYIGYSGRDKSVAMKKSVLNPKFPKDTDEIRSC